MLFPEFAVDPNFVERFRREAQAAANLNHPNIVNVFDWGKHASTYFIAMEYVDGRTLADILRPTATSTSKQAAEIASEVAAALGFAHAAGLVHRDIKPANILIGTNGSVKVADFGIARALNAPTESNLTQAGAVMGTATYFSPEQAQGAQPDPRSDLYSLGVVMYEMIAGRPPFTGDNPVGIAYGRSTTTRRRSTSSSPTCPGRSRRSSPSCCRRTRRCAIRPPMPCARTPPLPHGRATGRAAVGAPAPRRDRSSNHRDAGPRQRPAGTGAHRGPRPVPAGQRGGPPPGQHPSGVTVPARYREQSRTGWYALAAFFALVALGIGGFLLFNTWPTTIPVEPPAAQLRRPGALGGHRGPHPPRLRRTRSSRSRTTGSRTGSSTAPIPARAR